MLCAANSRLQKVYSSREKGVARGSGDQGARPSPLMHAAVLLHAEAPILEQNYLDSVEVAWRALRAVQAVLGGPKEAQLATASGGKKAKGGKKGARKGSKTGQGQDDQVDSAEVIVGRVFEILANEGLVKKVGEALASVVCVD